MQCVKLSNNLSCVLQCPINALNTLDTIKKYNTLILSKSPNFLVYILLWLEM